VVSVLKKDQMELSDLLCTEEIPAGRVGGQVDRCCPTTVHNSGDLAPIDAFCPHLHIHNLVDFHFYVPAAGQGEVEGRVLVGDHSHMILSVASRKLFTHNATTKKDRYCQYKKDCVNCAKLQQLNQ